MTNKRTRDLVSEYQRLRQRTQGASVGYRRMKFPKFEYLDDPFAKVVLSMFDKSPMPIGELRLRANLDNDEILNVLREKSVEYGEDVLTFPADEQTPARTLSKAIEAADDYSFSYIAPAGNNKGGPLAEYVYRALVQGLRNTCVEAAKFAVK